MALLESRRKLLQETTLCIFKLYEFVILQQFLSLNLVVIHINNIFMILDYFECGSLRV